MRLDELDICCARPMLVVEEREVPSASPYIIAPLWQVRIVCKNCGKNTYWVDNYNKATRLWQGEEFEIWQ